MNKVYYLLSLGLARITPFGLLVKGRNMVAKLTGNAGFANPVPPLAEVSAACDVMEAAIQAHGDNPGPREKDARDNAFDALKGMLVDLGGYVQAASNGNKVLIESAGCEVRKQASPVGELPAPQGMLARTSPYPGRLDVKWGGVRGRILYNLEICAGDPKVEADWSLLLQTSRNRYTAVGLESNKTYYFRVSALGTAGLSPASDMSGAKVA